MNEAAVNGVRLSYEFEGPEDGDPVVLICGTGQPALTWRLGLSPLLAAEGYRVLTYDNRGVPPSEEASPPYRASQLAEDAAALVEHLELAPCRVAGWSLGALAAQELALARPDLARGAVLMATAGRNAFMLRAWAEAHLEVLRAGIELPSRYEAVVTAMQVVGPAHLSDDEFMARWVEVASAAPPWHGRGAEGQYAADAAYEDRLEALGKVQVPCLVVAFEHDILIPAALGHEVAEAIPACRYIEVPGCGHAGPIEDPPAVSRVLLELFEGI